MQRLKDLESVDTETPNEITRLTDRIKKLEEIIESMGYYIPLAK
jgi:hypothetical protein